MSPSDIDFIIHQNESQNKQEQNHNKIIQPYQNWAKDCTMFYTLVDLERKIEYELKMRPLEQTKTANGIGLSLFNESTAR